VPRYAGARRWAAALFIIAASTAPTGAAPTAPPRIIADESGSAALLAAVPPARRGFLDVLSGEEVALAGGVLVQVRVEQDDASTDRSSGRVVSVFLGGPDKRLRPASALVFFNKTGYALPSASAPVVALYDNERANAYATLIAAAIGYAKGDAMVFRRRDGTLDTYNLRSDDNLFGCIQSGRMSGDACRVRRLSRYGIRSATQLRSYSAIARTDAWLAALWMLVRKREPNALFPTRDCRPNQTANCVSWAAFKKRSHTMIPTD
jgi:hypothetical protein